MSTRYNTRNPIESTDVRDMSDNAKNLDDFANSKSNEFTDRFGVERKTIHGMNSQFDSHILNMGFTRVGTFAAGATLTNPRQTLLWDIADGGDGQEYGWSGSFTPSGKVVPPGSTPLTTGGIAIGAWMSRFDPELRIQARESLRRSYAEAGYNLVDGSFESGGKLVNANDVLLQERTGKGFSGPAGTVAAGTNPAGGGFVDRSAETLRHKLALNTGAGMVATADGRTVQERFDNIPAEVDAAGTAAALISQHNSSPAAHPELSAFISAEANRAETAAEAAFVNADVYPDVATGRAAVANGDQFQVVQGVEIVRYRRDSSSSHTEVARYPSASIDSLQINRNKNYPFRQRIRGGVLTQGSAVARMAFLGARVIGTRESIEGKYFSIAYLQNGATLGGRNVAGVRVEEFDASTFETDGGSTVIHRTSDAPLEYTEGSTGVHTFSIRPALRPEITIELDIDVSALPSWGSPLPLGNSTSNAGWSFHIDKSCHFVNGVKDVPLFSRGVFPFKNSSHVGGDSVDVSTSVSQIFLDASIVAPVDKINGYVYRIDYLQNKANLLDQVRYGVRFSRYKLAPSGGYFLESREFIHEPADEEANYDIELGGIQTFSLRMAKDPQVVATVTLDTDRLSVGSTVNMWVDTANGYHTGVIHPSRYIPIPASNPEGGTGLSGIGTMGASLIASAGNYWVELSASILGVTAYNKAVSGAGIPAYFADLMWRGDYCTDTEFDDIDVLAIQFASSQNLDDESGLLGGAEVYTENFDAADSSNQFSANYSHAQCLDYILKYWQKWCFEQKDNTSSKWFGTQHGKPFRVIFVTHWHDARGYYNEPIRKVAKRWGAAVCELDRKIGFSKDTSLPNGDQVSIVYAYDTQTIDGVVYGWHPARGSSGKYIQTRMANIFAQAINEWFKQI